MSRCALFAFCSGLLIGSVVWAGEWYVAPNGLDTASGTDAQHPYATITRGLQSAKPGDTIHLAAGIYREAVTITNGGTATDPITIAGAGISHTILDGTDPLPMDPNGDGIGDWVDCGAQRYRYPLPDRFLADPVKMGGLGFTQTDYCRTEVGGSNTDIAYACRRESVWYGPPGEATTRLRWRPYNVAAAPTSTLLVGTYHVVRGDQPVAERTAINNAFCAAHAILPQQHYLYAALPQPPAQIVIAMTVTARGILIQDARPPGAPPVRHIRLQHLTVRRAATPGNAGGITIRGEDWTLDHIASVEHAWAGLVFSPPLAPQRPKDQDFADGHVVRQSTFRDNGVQGIGGGYLASALFELLDISSNNWQRMGTGTAGGGIKFAFVQPTVTIRQCRIAHNQGPGIWFDTGSHGTVVTDNLFIANEKAAVIHEASGPVDPAYDGQGGCFLAHPCNTDQCLNRMIGNVVVGSYASAPGVPVTDAAQCPAGCVKDPLLPPAPGVCCWKPPARGYGAGLFARESDGLVARENIFIGNAAGISLQNGASLCYDLQAVQLTDNTFAHSYEYHFGVRGGGTLSQPARYCIAGDNSGIVHALTCPALVAAGKSSQICDGSGCPTGSTSSASCLQFGCLVAEAEHVEAPAAHNLIDENRYGLTTDYTVLEALAKEAAPMLADYFFIKDGRKDYTYNWYAGNPLKTTWKSLSEIIGIVLPAMKGLTDATGTVSYEQRSVFHTAVVSVTATGIPWSYSPPAGASSAPAPLLVVRLRTSSPSTDTAANVAISVTLAPGSAAAPIVQWNGRRVPMSATESGSIALVAWSGTAARSSWHEDWLSMSTGPGQQVLAVTVAPHTTPPTPETPTQGLPDSAPDPETETAAPPIYLPPANIALDTEPESDIPALPPNNVEPEAAPVIQAATPAAPPAATSAAPPSVDPSLPTPPINASTPETPVPLAAPPATSEPLRDTATRTTGGCTLYQTAPRVSGTHGR